MRRTRQQPQHRIIVWIIAALLFSGAGVVTAVEVMSDTDISNAVEDALTDDPGTRAWNVDVAVNAGVVTLQGTVNSMLAQQRADKVAATVKGVSAVINDLEVAESARSDAEVKQSIEATLRTDPVTEPWEVEVFVDNGEVTLSGTVESWQEKQLVATKVKGVSGVQSLKNQIKAGYQAERPDPEIREEIEGALRWDAYVDDALIDVMVDDGKVTLSGTVGSLAEKREAAAEAWVAGVWDVENDLDIEAWTRDPRFREDKYAEKTDLQVEQAVEDAFVYDPRVNRFDILVDAVAGEVILRGTVDHLDAKRAAARDARGVVGVWSVDNRIKVRPEPDTELADSAIREAVGTALLWDPYVERHKIDVSVVDGEVYLRGEVDTAFEKAHADDVASRATGVRTVHNYLRVNLPAPAVSTPYVDDWVMYDFAWYTPPSGGTPASDWEIQKDIQDELFWSPFVDSDEVNVTVDDGVAILTGTVETWGERDAAADNALQGGAVAVDNNLAVHYGPEYYQP